MAPFDFSLNHHLELPDDVFRLLRDASDRRTGILFPDASKYLLQKRLSPRARELNFESFQKYFYFLQYDPRADAEFDEICDLVTTKETYFFREPAQLTAFVEEIVPEVLSRKPGKKIRVWSAGCSTGEEPYSIAMMLEESRHFDHAGFEIFASDISQQVLVRARKGQYRENAFRPSRDTHPFAGERDYAAVHCPVAERACSEEGVWLVQSLLLGTRRDMDDVVAAIRKIQAAV